MILITRPPVRYPGGKWRLGQWIIDKLPPHLTYVEPYCGGASVLFQKPPSYFEVINDLDGSVVNFFTVLRTRTDDLVRAIDLTPFAREEYRLSFLPCEDELENARRFYVRTRQAWGSMARRTGWRFQRSTNRGKKVIDEWAEIDHLWAAAERLKGVMIEHDDALKVIARFDDERTLFYVDPPYMRTSRNRIDHYNHEMNDEGHRQLAGVLHNVKGMVILSGYPSALYDELYQGWTVLEKNNQINGNHMAVERLWLSPKTVDLGSLPLFGGVGVFND